MPAYIHTTGRIYDCHNSPTLVNDAHLYGPRTVAMDPRFELSAAPAVRLTPETVAQQAGN
jgi:hypothetical protein